MPDRHDVSLLEEFIALSLELERETQKQYPTPHRERWGDVLREVSRRMIFPPVDVAAHLWAPEPGAMDERCMKCGLRRLASYGTYIYRSPSPMSNGVLVFTSMSEPACSGGA